RTDPAAARASVLSGIRQRRARRLRAAGGAVVAIAALGIALPLVLVGSGVAPPGPHAPESAALGLSPTSTPPRFGLLAPVAVPGSHTRSTPASTGRCLVGTAAVTPCGDLVAGPGADQAGATNSSATGSSAAGSATGSIAAGSATEYRAAAAPAPAALHVRVGGLFEVTLPRLTGRRTWSTPRLAETYHGTGTPLEVRHSPRTRVPRAGWQGFVVRATAAGTFELDARAQAPTTAQGPPSGVRPRATWTLEVEVTGK
ncbi:MAG: hypothetical protein ACYCU6_13525, partial [Acidimicrobiales bacterium]